jgi:hypothetical protein
MYKLVNKHLAELKFLMVMGNRMRLNFRRVVIAVQPCIGLTLEPLNNAFRNDRG